MNSPKSVWLVSNKNFDSASSGSFFFHKGFKSSFNFGYKFRDDFIGYNIVIDENEIIISNDPLATLPIYYFYKNGVWACSNNLWELCRFENLTLNTKWFKKNSFYYHSPKEGETFINEIKLLKTGFFLNCTKLKLFEKERENPLFKFSKTKIISDERVAINKIISNLDDFFVTWKNTPNLYLGNSGGFDSRLMRAMMAKHNIEYNSYTTLRVKQNLFLSSTTEFCAKKTDELFGKSNYYFNTESSNIYEDVLWNPLGSAESSKVPSRLFFEIISKKNPFIFCGGNGYIVGYNNLVWSDLHTQNLYNTPRFFLKGFAYENIYGKSKERTNIYGHVNIEEDLSDVKELLKDTKLYSGLDRVRFLQSRLLNKYSAGGGYESLLYSGFPVYMYYPSLTGLVSKIDDKILKNRDLLEKIILEVNPKLNYRGQNGKRPLKEMNYESKLWAKIRGSGIQNINVSDNQIDKFIKQSENSEFLRELYLLFPLKNSLDFFNKLMKFDYILDKLKSENIY